MIWVYPHFRKPPYPPCVVPGPRFHSGKQLGQPRANSPLQRFIYIWGGGSGTVGQQNLRFRFIGMMFLQFLTNTQKQSWIPTNRYKSHVIPKHMNSEKWAGFSGNKDFLDVHLSSVCGWNIQSDGQWWTNVWYWRPSSSHVRYYWHVWRTSCGIIRRYKLLPNHLVYTSCFFQFGLFCTSPPHWGASMAIPRRLIDSQASHPCNVAPRSCITCLKESPRIMAVKCYKYHKLSIHINFPWFKSYVDTNLMVSWNRATSKSFILVGLSIPNHPFWGSPMTSETSTWTYPRLPAAGAAHASARRISASVGSPAAGWFLIVDPRNLNHPIWKSGNWIVLKSVHHADGSPGLLISRLGNWAKKRCAWGSLRCSRMERNWLLISWNILSNKMDLSLSLFLHRLRAQRSAKMDDVPFLSFSYPNQPHGSTQSLENNEPLGLHWLPRTNRRVYLIYEPWGVH